MASAVFTVTWVEIASAAEQSGTIRLAGRVPPRGAISVAQSSFGLPGGRLAAGQQIWLSDLLLSSNHRGLKVSLVSRNADDSGRAVLVDEETGASVPYRVIFGGEEIDVSTGERTLLNAQRRDQASPEPRGLEIGLPADADLKTGRYQEQLLLVIRAP